MEDGLELHKFLVLIIFVPWSPSSCFSSIGHPKPEICERTGMKSDVIVFSGVHDSNGSLVSFLATSTTSTTTKEGETKHHEFVLTSTGT